MHYYNQNKHVTKWCLNMYNIARSILCSYPVSVVISSEPLPDCDLIYFLFILHFCLPVSMTTCLLSTCTALIDCFFFIFSGSPVEMELIIVGCSPTAAVRNRFFWKRREILWMHCEEQGRCDLSEECWTRQRQPNKYEHLWDVWMQSTEICMKLLEEELLSLFILPHRALYNT